VHLHARAASGVVPLDARPAAPALTGRPPVTRAGRAALDPRLSTR
jgi:hypothetical protein